MNLALSTLLNSFSALRSKGCKVKAVNIMEERLQKIRLKTLLFYYLQFMPS